jgi:hypothetical protein
MRSAIMGAIGTSLLNILMDILADGWRRTMRQTGIWMCEADHKSSMTGGL